MKDFLKFERHKDWGVFARMAAAMYLLFPERRKELQVGRTTRDHLFWAYSESEPESSLDVTDLKILYGSGTKKLLTDGKREITEDSALYIIKLVKDNIKHDGLRFLARDICDLFILSPEIVPKLKYIEGLYDLFIDKLPYEEDFSHLASVAFAGRLLNPTYVPIKNIDRNILEKFKSTCISKIESPEEHLKDEFIDSIEELAYLKLLTAHKVKSTVNGIEIIMQPDAIPEDHLASQMPVFKRF
jgi:hypothetical protein